MTLKYGMLGVVLLMATPFAVASTAPDPFYGDDVQARAVLDCQADYAQRYAKAATAQRATATEVATAAHAKCAGEFEAFLRSRFTSVGEAEKVRAMMAPGEFVEQSSQRMRDYAHAHTMHVYLISTADF